MKMGLRALVIVATIVALGSLAGCGKAPAIRVMETIRVSDSPQTSPAEVIRVTETICVTDFPQTPLSAEARVVENIRVNDSAQTYTSVIIQIVETISVSDSPILTPTQVQPTPPPPSPVQVIVTVASPKAGVVWRTGTAQNVAWATTGEGIAYVGIYYSTDGGKSMFAIAQQESNDGIYTWKVPNTPSKTVLVRVLAYNANGGTLALGDSGLFTISIQ